MTIPNSVTSIGEMTFQGCSGLTSITIPNNVTTIGKSAFNGCSGLTSVTIGSGIKTISAYAFAKCSEVADVYCYAENVPQTESNTFADSYINHSTLHVPAGTIDKYKATTVWNDFANIVEMEAPHYSYNLTYIVDGQEYKTYSIDSQTTITPEAEPEKEGYTFSGWSEIPETMPAHDVIITGSFTINSYKLTYVVDGEENSVETVEYGTTITKKEQPTKEGYTFSGWSEVPETMPAHDVTITGSFTINSYKLTYVIDGETYKEIELEYGAEVTPEADLEKEGFTFSGWSEIPTTMPAHDVVVTGSFTRGAYKLIYIVDGEIYKTYSKDYQDAITAEATPEREGYTFSGWSEIPETMPAHDVTVTGTFTINHYTLTLKVGENVYETQTLDYGSAITLPEMPELTGYTFTWGEAPETMPAQNLTIIGTYNSNYYNVTYLIDGQFYSIVKVQFGSTITPPEVPEREGSTFAWIDVPATMPAHDIVIEGSYTDALKDVMQEGYKGEIYTLDGKKVNRMQRGVNIIRRGSRTIKVRR